MSFVVVRRHMDIATLLSAALLASACVSGGTGGTAAPVADIKVSSDASAGETGGDAVVDITVVDAPGADGAKADAAPDAKAETVTPDTKADTLPPEGLDAFMLDRMAAAEIPGLSACIFTKGKIVWCKAWGEADIDAKTKATANTVYGIGSLSATVTGVALLQLVEAGKLALDDDIDKHLPFSVRNPSFPKDKITPRMLLAHTSGIQDTSTDALVEAMFVPDDPTETLAQFAANAFKPGGKYYDKANFTKVAPGAEYAPSTWGIALAGYLVEVVAKQPFDAYCAAKIFGPLKMTATTWRFSKVDPKALATMYFLDDQGEDVELVAWSFATFLGYPASNLYTSAADYARFFFAISQGGSLDGAQILKPATVATMLTPVIEIEEGFEQSLTWTQVDLEDGQLIGQNGGLDSTGVEAYYRVGDKTGYVLFTNGGWSYSETDEDDLIVYEIEDRLLEEADLVK